MLGRAVAGYSELTASDQYDCVVHFYDHDFFFYKKGSRWVYDGHGARVLRGLTWEQTAEVLMKERDEARLRVAELEQAHAASKAGE